MTALSFHNTQFEVIDYDGQPWLRLPQIGAALDYSRSDAVNKIYQSNADEFNDSMTALIKLPDLQHRNDGAGQLREVRIFSLRGCHLLAMFARTKVAKEFRHWVLDVLEHPNQSQYGLKQLPKTQKALPGGLTLEQQDCIKSLVKERVEQLPKAKQGKAALQCWSAIKSKFGKSYKELPPEHFIEIVSLVSRLELKGDPLLHVTPLELDALVDQRVSLALEGEHIPKQEASGEHPYDSVPFTESRDYGAAEVRLEHIANWAAATKNAALLQDIEVVKRCLISAWTEMDEAIFRMNHAVNFLKRWRTQRI